MMRLILVMFATIPLIASANGRVGGVDGAGGEFIYNTRNEVIDAVNSAWAEVTQWHPRNPMLIGFYHIKQKEWRNDEEKELLRIYETIFMVEANGTIPLAKFEKVTERARMQKLYFAENALCDGPEDKKYLASVTRLDWQGDICVSIKGLMERPSASLRFDLVGLFVHEIAHLSGLKEDDARRIQRYILKNILKVLRLDGFHTKTDSVSRLWTKIVQNWRILVHYGDIDSEIVKNIYRLSREIRRFELVDPAGQRDYVEVASLGDLPRLNAELENLQREVSDYADELEDALRANRKAFTVRHLQRAGRIAHRLVKLQQDYQTYLFGGLKPQAGIKSETDAEWEIEQISKVTNATTLTDPTDRLGDVYCQPDPVDANSPLKDQVDAESSGLPSFCESVERPHDADANGVTEDTREPAGGETK